MSQKENSYIKKSWGRVRNLHNTNNTITRELIVNPRGCMSYRRHSNRSKLWLIAEGELNMVIDDKPLKLSKFNMIVIKAGSWHTSYLEAGSEPATIIETYLNSDDESPDSDIERKKLPEFVPLYVGFNGI